MLFFFGILLTLGILFLIFGVRIVQQNTVAVVEFLGKYRRIMNAGLNIKIPVLRLGLRE